MHITAIRFANVIKCVVSIMRNAHLFDVLYILSDEIQ